MRHAGGDKVMAQVLAAVLGAVELLIDAHRVGALSAEHVPNVLARLNAKPTPESLETALPLKEAPLASAQAGCRSGNFIGKSGSKCVFLEARSLSDLGIVGCKSTAAVHFSPSF